MLELVVTYDSLVPDVIMYILNPCRESATFYCVEREGTRLHSHNKYKEKREGGGRKKEVKKISAVLLPRGLAGLEIGSGEGRGGHHRRKNVRCKNQINQQLRSRHFPLHTHTHLQTSQLYWNWQYTARGVGERCGDVKHC